MSGVAELAQKTGGGHFTKELYGKLGLVTPNLAISRNNRQRMYKEGQYKGMKYPLAHSYMWRGNHNKYRYNKFQTGAWGESATNQKYHQHFAHAKDPTDYQYGSGNNAELLSVKRGKMKQNPLPKVQYVSKDSKPSFNYKSWHDSFDSREIWQREVLYPEHIPEHLGAKRPLAPQAPSALHSHMHLAHMDKITITICPFMFGYGRHLQKNVLDFYRRCLSARSPFPNEKVFLNYTIDYISPVVAVTWLDGDVYEVPLLESARAHDITQLIMEQSWLAADKMDAAGRTLQPLPVDDYKWQQVLNWKKKKKDDGDAAGGDKKK